MNRLERVVLAIVGTIVTVACSALPSTVPTTPNATSPTLSTLSTASSGSDFSSLDTSQDTSTTTPAVATVSATATQAASTDQRVYVEVLSATDSPADDVNAVTTASAQALVASMNAYWSAESGGAVGISFAGIESRSLGLDSCDPAALFSSVPEVAFDKRFADSRWQGTGEHLLILTSEACNSAGQGSVGGNGGIMLSGNGAGDALGVPVALHEFGHNLGFGHAGTSICRSNITMDAAVTDFGDDASFCPTQEYGDPLDIMGYSLAGAAPHLSSPQRIRMGWMTDFTSITNATPSSTTTVTPLDGAAGNRALRITDPLSGAIYYVEYRTASGADATSSEFTAAAKCVVTGTWVNCSRGASASLGSVRILRELPYRAGTPYLRTTALAVGSTGIDTTRDTRFTAGDTFASSGGGFYVTVNAMSPATGASVTVRFTPPAQTSTAVTLNPSSTTAFGSRVDLRARVASTDGGAASGTVTFRDGNHVLGTQPVVAGAADLTVPTSLKIGTHRITADYTPTTGDTAASTAAVKKLVVTKAKSTLRVTVKHHRATVKVTSTLAVRGSVRLSTHGAKTNTVSLRKGVATIALPKGTTSFTVRYAGTSTVKAATLKKRVR